MEEEKNGNNENSENETGEKNISDASTEPDVKPKISAETEISRQARLQLTPANISSRKPPKKAQNQAFR